MLQKSIVIQEVYHLNHIHDKNNNGGYDADGKYIKNLISPVLLKNDIINGFIEQLEPLASNLVESSLPLRNLYNIVVDKFYDNHSK